MAQTEMASLRRALVWQRTSPTPEQLDGPVLYTIIIRSSATPGNIPKISSNYTLANSLISDTGTTVMIGGVNGLVVDGSTGIITFAPNQTFPAPNGGGFLPLSGGTLTGVLGGTSGNFSGTLSANFFSGDGSALTNVNAVQLGGQLPGFYQQRVGGNCSPGTSVVAVNVNGTVVCGAPSLPRYFNSTNLHTVLDSGQGAGNYTSITIGTDGLPIIGYQGGANLRVVHCTAADCSTHGVVTVDNTLGAGQYTSITIGTDGLPIISYRAFGGVGGSANFNVVHCTAVDCSTHGAVTVPDSATIEGFYGSITIGTDGLPIISYTGGGVGYYDLSVVHCTAVDCSTHGAVTVLDNATFAGFYTSITIGTDGLPIISYRGGGGGNLTVVHCTAVDCSTYGAFVLDNSTNAGQYTSITIGTDGLPIISYQGINGTQNLGVVHCTAVDCSTHGAATVLDNATNAGQYTSITIGTDGLPIISYAGFSSGHSNLSVVHCTAVDCSTHGAVTVLDNATNAGQYTSITIGTDGLPIISYEDINGDLSVMHCANVLCAPPFVRRR
jgi:hypothetical protein